MFRHLDNKGDTIVEVLIAIAIASSVLGGAFVIVHRTMQNSQQAQEHSEALGIAQGQLEQIQAASVAGDTELRANPQHCFDSDGALQVINPTLSLPSNNDSDVYPAGCSGLGSAKYYRTAFAYDSASNAFTVYVDWPSATGQGDDHVSLSYRAYEVTP